MAFGIIGTLIEAHSGQRFDQFMREQVLLPMGIGGSFNVQDLDDIAQLSVLYRNSAPQADSFNGVMPPAPDLSGYAIGSNGLYFAPQGGLRCSALELMRVATMLLNDGTIDDNAILQPATVQAMLANEWTWNGSNGNNYYGLISDLYFDPQSRFALVLISNGYTPGNSYATGVSSAFYRVEEEVYAALAGTALAGCLALGAKPIDATEQLLLTGRVVHWHGTDVLVCEALGFDGRLIDRFRIPSGGQWTAPDSLGPLLVRGLRTDGSAITVRMN